MVDYVTIESVQMETRGPVPEGAVDLARDRVVALLRLAKEPVVYARVKLTVLDDPAMPRLAVAQANLDVNGRPVRAQSTAETMWRAVNELRDRLLIRLARVSLDWPHRRGGRALTNPRDWRPAGVPARRPPDLCQTHGRHYVVRHKTVKPVMVTPIEAALDMELLDYDFYLFTDMVTERDCVVRRNGVRYRLARVGAAAERRNGADRPGRGGGAFVVDERPAPVLTPVQAVALLNTRDLALVFFADAETRCGRIVYRRYDGHYGMISPSEY
ncbi:MAG TPA: sigma 54 modulation/S30EA ribosomal C-terminal domain-containing protein [Streptosporangiaceae bacterium]|jgi:hypothetical protein